MTRYALPLLLIAAGLLPGCFCFANRGCVIRDGDMMDCGPCPDDPAITIPLPWARPINSQPAPQTPLEGTPPGTTATPRTRADAPSGVDAQASASGRTAAPSSR